MGVFKNEVGRPSNRTIIVRNILKGILVAVVGVCLVAVGYFLNDYKNNENDKDDKNEIIKDNKQLTKNEVEEIISNIFTTGEYSNLDYWLYLYDVDANLFDINSEQFKLNIALDKTEEIKDKYSCNELFGNKDLVSYFPGKNFEDSNLRCEGDSKQYLYDDVNVTFKSLFGSDLIAPKESIQIYSLPYAYVKEKNVYVQLLFDTGGVPAFSISGLIDYKQEKNKLYVTYGIARKDFNEGPDINIKLSDGTLIKMNSESYEKSREKYFNDYKDKLFKYELTFKLENNNYVFESIKKYE